MSRIDQAIILNDLGRYDRAIEILQTQLSENPWDSDAQAYLGILLSKIDRFDEANEAIELAIHRAPDSPYVHFARGWVLSQQDKWELAIEATRESLKLAPLDESAFCLLAHCFYKLGDYEKCLENADLGLEIDPENIHCIDNRAWALLELKRIEEAQLTAQRGLQVDPEYANLHNCLSLIERERGFDELAKNRLIESLRIEPTQNWTAGELERIASDRVHTYLDLNDLTRATEFIDEMLLINPDSSYAYMYLGEVSIKRCEFEEAVKHLEKAVELDPSQEWAVENLRASRMKADGMIYALSKKLANQHLPVKFWYEAIQVSAMVIGSVIAIVVVTKALKFLS